MSGDAKTIIRIYYGDGTVYHVSDDNPLAEAPPLNAQVVVHTDVTGGHRDCGLMVTHNWDYYIVHPDGDVWGENGEVDFVEHVLFSTPVKCSGNWTTWRRHPARRSPRASST